jgi:hypothetical protein
MPKNVYDTEKRTCDRCGFDYKKSSLRKQRGLWLSHDCFDDTDKIQHPRVRWQSPRDNSTTVTIPSEAEPEVYTFGSAGGIDLITQSNELVDRRDGRHLSFYMKVKSDGGAISISANPQITPGQVLGDLLTLRGTSDTDSITLVDGRGLRLFGGSGASVGLPFTLEEGDAISFVYANVAQGWGSMLWGSDPWGDGSGGADEIPIWVETSRFKGGI